MNLSNEVLEQDILLVDDEEYHLSLLKDIFTKEGFTKVHTAMNGIDGILKCKEVDPKVILLDVNLPDIEGYMVCNKIREFSFCPIIFLTANSDEEQKLRGLECGADDYITKPFNIKEVILKVKMILKRNAYVQNISCKESEIKKQQIYTFGEVSVNEESGEIKKRGHSIALTAKEYALLLFLVKNPNRIFSKSSLCESIWGYEYDGNDNTIMVHIRHLREKLEDDPSTPKYIKTLKGLGYKLQK